MFPALFTFIHSKNKREKLELLFNKVEAFITWIKNNKNYENRF